MVFLGIMATILFTAIYITIAGLLMPYLMDFYKGNYNPEDSAFWGAVWWPFTLPFMIGYNITNRRKNKK